MVLLPAVERDSVVSVLRTLVDGGRDGAGTLLLAATSVSLVVPFVALWLVLRDLTQFYFHANHIEHGDGSTFAPRFTLTGLRMPSDELGPAATAALEAERADPRAVHVLVPSNEAARAGIDRRVRAYGGLGSQGPITDQGRAEALLELAASRSRTLLDEVAKVEYGMARHVLRTQMIVLRYVKALLALLTTALAVFAAAAVVADKGALTTGDEMWLAGVFLAWAPMVIVAVSTPVRWLDRQLRSEGATHTAVARDQELTRVESVTVRLALVGFAASAAAMVVCLARAGAADQRTFGAVVLGVAAVVLVGVIRHWADGHPLTRITGRA
jgi:hypothetical protein